MKSSNVIFGCASNAILSNRLCSLVLRTNPGGRECLYLHSLFCFGSESGHVQNQPYFPSSTARMKCLQTMSVVVFGLPCLDKITFLSFSSSQLSIVSNFFSSSLSSEYKSLLAAFLPTVRSWLNLQFLPLVHAPALKNSHKIDFGSTPNGTFCVGIDDCSSLAASFLASSAAFFSAARCLAMASARLSTP
ncbi:hypothetical protein OGAPHI_001136 [Ogataea philodendri]|uniref:Uncharacterized protein n=1 Tax=Ogataea philodendri TaxID=1378263 RepID=A0A9P8T989_9ASCO|nr:uncharacterized protein OGAPHI_001136 [Ogataea philodendri]KAH3670621.1 hypothetical protein OGAPHI_001136 [Ogataea philodendri]